MGLRFGKWYISQQSVIIQTRLAYVTTSYLPLVDNHILVIPKRIVPYSRFLTSDEIKDIAQLVKICTENPKYHYNIAQQDGKSAGQSVSHVHVHVLFRSSDDKFNRVNRSDLLYELLEQNALDKAELLPETRNPPLTSFELMNNAEKLLISFCKNKTKSISDFNKIFESSFFNDIINYFHRYSIFSNYVRAINPQMSEKTKDDILIYFLEDIINKDIESDTITFVLQACEDWKKHCPLTSNGLASCIYNAFCQTHNKTLHNSSKDIKKIKLFNEDNKIVFGHCYKKDSTIYEQWNVKHNECSIDYISKFLGLLLYSNGRNRKSIRSHLEYILDLTVVILDGVKTLSNKNLDYIKFQVDEDYSDTILNIPKINLTLSSDTLDKLVLLLHDRDTSDENVNIFYNGFKDYILPIEKTERAYIHFLLNHVSQLWNDLQRVDKPQNFGVIPYDFTISGSYSIPSLPKLFYKMTFTDYKFKKIYLPFFEKINPTEETKYIDVSKYLNNEFFLVETDDLYGRERNLRKEEGLDWKKEPEFMFNELRRRTLTFISEQKYTNTMILSFGGVIKVDNTILYGISLWEIDNGEPCEILTTFLSKKQTKLLLTFTKIYSCADIDSELPDFGVAI